MHSERFIPLIMVASLVTALSACRMGPDYVRPAMPLPQEFKASTKWKVAEPQDAVPRGRWWEIYADPVLNDLAAQVVVSNQNVQVALAQYRQARAMAQAARAGLFPSLDAELAGGRNFSAARSKDRYAGAYSLGLEASWEIDLWGRVARGVEVGQASLQASEALVASAQLSAQTDLVLNYFQLRTSDELRVLQGRTVDAYERTLQLTENRLNAGVATRAEVAQARAQLLNARAQAADLGIQRAQFENAIAILMGRAPSDFSLAAAPLTAKLPTIPAGIPSALLERRPDIAAAERRAAAANAQIGVAKAAYFPSLSLNAGGGYQSTNLSDWLSAPGRVWSLGASLAQSVFDGGARKARTAQAEAGFDAVAAEYRQTVLGALQEVEDNLVAVGILADELEVQIQASAAAREAEQLVLNQYRAGTVSYVNVAVAQATANATERLAVLVRGRQYSANVLLIKALGGGW